MAPICAQRPDRRGMEWRVLRRFKPDEINSPGNGMWVKSPGVEHMPAFGRGAAELKADMPRPEPLVPSCLQLSCKPGGRVRVSHGGAGAASPHTPPFWHGGPCHPHRAGGCTVLRRRIAPKPAPPHRKWSKMTASEVAYTSGYKKSEKSYGRVTKSYVKLG